MTRASDRLEEIQAALRAAGKRVTSAKRAVAQALIDVRRDLTADEVTQRVQARAPEVSPSTVYRVLEELESLGLVVHAHLGRSAAVYHLAGPVHGHLVCERCGATIEVPARDFDPLAGSLQRSYGFTLDRHHVALSGLCRDCRAARG
ncbi:MAG TPA: Fur family transcriptional regulator [Acidimicrobiales bacterium]|nr:Fur family transcriptional regulator [Acidimicrobiales bacterium]